VANSRAMTTTPVSVNARPAPHPPTHPDLPRKVDAASCRVLCRTKVRAKNGRQTENTLPAACPNRPLRGQDARRKRLEASSTVDAASCRVRTAAGLPSPSPWQGEGQGWGSLPLCNKRSLSQRLALPFLLFPNTSSGDVVCLTYCARDAAAPANSRPPICAVGRGGVPSLHEKDSDT
jgi:hypothetical protein